MRFSSRPSKVSILISLVALTGIIGAFAATAVISRGSVKAVHAAASTSSYKGVMTNAQLTGSVNPATMPKSSAGDKKHVVAPWHKSSGTNGKTPNSSKTSNANGRPTASSSGWAPKKLVHAFQGVSAVDNSNATGGFDLEPPDEGLAASNGYAANFVNLTGAIYNANGSIAA